VQEVTGIKAYVVMANAIISFSYDFNETFKELLEASSVEPIPTIVDGTQPIAIVASVCPKPIEAERHGERRPKAPVEYVS